MHFLFKKNCNVVFFIENTVLTVNHSTSFQYMLLFIGILETKWKGHVRGTVAHTPLPIHNYHML